MALVTIICPNCGGQAQIEAGRSAMCPYCGRELSAQAAAQSGMAMAQEMQFAQDVQFAPPPAQQAMQMQPQIQPDAMAMPQMQQTYQPQQYSAPMYTPDQLRQAEKMRNSWYSKVGIMMAVQALVMAWGIFFASAGWGLGIAMILAWVLSLPFCAMWAAFSRPDQAYLDKKPMLKSKIAQGIFQFIFGAAASAAVGGILFAIFYALFG